MQYIYVVLDGTHWHSHLFPKAESISSELKNVSGNIFMSRGRHAKAAVVTQQYPFHPWLRLSVTQQLENVFAHAPDVRGVETASDQANS